MLIKLAMLNYIVASNYNLLNVDQAAPGAEGAGYSGERPGAHNDHLTLHQAQLGEQLYPKVHHLIRF